MKREVNLLIQPSRIEEPGRALAESEHEVRRSPDTSGNRPPATLIALLPSFERHFEGTALEPSRDISASDVVLGRVLAEENRRILPGCLDLEISELRHSLVLSSDSSDIFSVLCPGTP